MLYEQKQQNENRKITWKIEKIKGVKSEIHSSRAKLKIREVHVCLPSFNSKGGVNITRGRKDERSFRKKKKTKLGFGLARVRSCLLSFLVHMLSGCQLSVVRGL